jgi:hypothetical protein
MWQESQQAKRSANTNTKMPTSVIVNLGEDDDNEDEYLDPNHNKGLVIEILDKKGAAAAKK